MIRRNLGRATMAFVLVTSLLTLGTGASAYTPANQNDLYEIKLERHDFMTYEGFDRESGVAMVEDKLVARYGGRWQVHAWNAYSATPRHLYGTSVQLSSALQSPEAVESMARQVIAANVDVLGADGSNLRLHATPHALGKWVAHFQQTYQGLDVEGAKVRVAFSDSGRLLLMGSDYFSGIDLNASPTLVEATARAIATEALPYDPATDSVEAGVKLLVLPVPVAANRVEHHLVWRLRVHTASPLGIWVTDVDAHSGEILQRMNDIHFDFAGDTENDAQVYGICDGVSTIPTPYLDLSVSGAGSTTTDANGEWSVAGGGGTGTVTASMSGPYTTVDDFRSTNDASFSGTATAGVPFTVYWDDSNARQDERTTFDAVNDIHDFFDLFDPSFGYSNAHINAYVNRTDGYCPGNAWWNGTINFCEAGGSYNNTGELQQVIHHEFGHGVQDHIIGSQGGEGLGEGNSDILGNLMTQDPIIGRGFYVGNCVSGIRNSVNTLQYPGDLNGSVHHDGQIIAGFNWDAMVVFQDMMGGGMNWDSPGTIKSAQLWHFGRILMHPTVQPDQVFATFFADDDNDNMDDGTPNYDILCAAAENHGFECPEILVGVFIEHTNLPYTANTAESYEVSGTAVSLGGGEIVSGSAEIYYSVNGGGFASVPMSPTGGTDEYSGMIPAQAFGSVVEYYLQASNDLGATGSSPRSAPGELHYFQVDDEFTDEMEFDTAWGLGTALGENTAATGKWNRGDPVATTSTSGQPVQPGDDHTAAPGTDCWVTDYAGTSGGSNDVDNGITTLYSPRFDLVGASDVSISYWRFYTNDRGTTTDDYWTVQLTNDDGATWTNVEYSNSLPYAWENVVVNLADYYPTPGIVQLRFIAADEGQGSLVEALIDDFILMGTFDLTPVDDGISVAFVTNLAQNSPNPFNPTTEIRFSLEQAGHASLKVFDAQGRLVSTLANGQMTAGPQVVTWNGNSDSGQRVASGVYFYRLETEQKVISKRMVLLK